MDVVVATGNRHKLAELRTLFGDLPVRLVGMDDAPTKFEPAEETGATFQENADLKAVHAYVKSLRPAGERAPQLRATRTEADRSSCAVSTMRCSVNSKGEGVTLWVASCARPAAASAEILEQIHQQQRLSGQVSPRPRAAVHVPALPTVYLCSLRALQRYRSSSPQCGHLIAASWSLDSAKAGLLPAGVSATAMTSPHDLFLHSQPR